MELAVKSGRYGSASEVVKEGRRLIEAREAKLQALRETLNASVAEGGVFTDEDLDSALEDKARELKKSGF